VVTRGYSLGAEVIPDGVASLVRLEVWSTFQCAGGAREAFLPVSECERVVTIERTQHDDQGELVLSKASDAATYIETGKVIRFLYTNGAFTEWLVWTIDDSSRESQVMRCSLRSVLATLDTGAAVLSETTGTQSTVDLEWKALAPSEQVSKILAFAPSWWTAGTITPTIPVDLVPSGWLPLRALRELVTAIRAQAVSCELHYTRNGTVGYYLDIVTSIGSDEDTLDVRTAKNLIGTSRRRDHEKYAVEVVPLGTGSPRGTIGKTWFELTAKATHTLTFQQPVTGGKVLAFDDQLNTNYYLIDDTGTAQQITDCVAGATQTITVTSGTNFTVGRWYRPTLASGTEALRLRASAGTAGQVRLVESQVLDGTTNLQTNPAMRVWTGAASSPPDGWLNGEGLVTPVTTLTRTTTPGLWKYGGKSARLQHTSGASQSIFSPNLTVYVPTWATSIVFSMWLYPVAIPNQSRLFAQVDSADVGSGTLITSLTLNQYNRVDVTLTSAAGNYTTGAAHALRCRLQMQGTPASDVYCDAVQISFAATATEFVEGSNPAKLWALGNQYLATYSTRPVSYGCSFADLNMWDPTGFRWDAVALGQNASVTDSDLGITTSGRIIELKRDWKNPLASQLTIATRPEEFVSLLTGIAA
jgi:hypothetical protein